MLHEILQASSLESLHWKSSETRAARIDSTDVCENLSNLYPVRIVHDLGGSVDQVSRAWVSVDVECGARIEIVSRPPVWMFSALSVEYEGVQCDRGYEDNFVVDCLDYSYRDQ